MSVFEPDLDLEETEQEETPDANGSFKQLRDHAKRLEKQLRQAQKELEELRTFRAERETADRKTALATAFREVGLSEKHVELFMAVRPDVEPTVDAVRRFALDYELIRAEEPKESEDGFVPAPPAGVPAGSKRYGADEWWVLYKENPAEALKVATEGRAEFKTTL